MIVKMLSQQQTSYIAASHADLLANCSSLFTAGAVWQQFYVGLYKNLGDSVNWGKAKKTGVAGYYKCEWMLGE